MHPMFKDGWSAKNPPSFEEAYAAIAAFQFDGLTGLHKYHSLLLQPFFEWHDRELSAVTRFVDFLDACPQELIDDCASELREHVANVLVNAMAFAWHPADRDRLCAKVESVLGRFLPASRKIAHSLSNHKLIESCSPAELKAALVWKRTLSRRGSKPLIVDGCTSDLPSIDYQLRQTDSERSVAESLTGRSSDNGAILIAESCRMDRYRTLSASAKYVSATQAELNACAALYESLSDSTRHLPVRWLYRLDVTRQWLGQKDICVVGISPAMHDEWAANLARSSDPADRACVMIAQVNAAVAKGDAKTVSTCVEKIRAAPAVVLEHKSLFTLEAAVVAAEAIPPLACHFWREIRLNHEYVQRLERAKHLHRLIVSGCGKVFVDEPVLKKVGSVYEDLDGSADDFGRILRHAVYWNHGAEADDRFWTGWCSLSKQDRTRHLPSLLRSLMSFLSETVKLELCHKGLLRGELAFSAVADAAVGWIKISRRVLLEALTSWDGKARTEHLLRVLEPLFQKKEVFICTSCGHIRSASRVAGDSLQKCRCCDQDTTIRDAKPLEVLCCPFPRRPQWEFATTLPSGDPWPNVARRQGFCPCDYCLGQKVRLVNPLKQRESSMAVKSQPESQKPSP